MGVHCNIFWQWVHQLQVTDIVHQLYIKELDETMAIYSNSEMGLGTECMEMVKRRHEISGYWHTQHSSDSPTQQG